MELHLSSCLNSWIDRLRKGESELPSHYPDEMIIRDSISFFSSKASQDCRSAISIPITPNIASAVNPSGAEFSLSLSCNAS